MTGDTSEASPWIVNTTAETFEQDVLERSQHVLVVLDFWAEWCGPCKLLTPIIEQLARDYAGQFVLVKVNIDQLQAQAGQFGIQSIPTVVAMLDGQPIDYFAGVMPEDQLREWIDRLLQASSLAGIRDLESSDPAAAEQKYREAMLAEPENMTLLTGLGRTLVAQGKVDEAHQIVERLEAGGFLDSEGEQLRSQLHLKDHGDDDLAALRQSAAQAPDDLPLQKQLADALAARGKYEPALDICLQLVERDPSGVGDEARQLMLDVFRILPPDSEIVTEYRRRLTALLY